MVRRRRFGAANVDAAWWGEGRRFSRVNERDNVGTREVAAIELLRSQSEKYTLTRLDEQHTQKSCGECTVNLERPRQHKQNVLRTKAN